MNIPVQFQTPTPKALENMDAYLQFSDYAKQWERTEVPGIFYRNNDGGTWEDVQKANDRDFTTAWYKTIAFILAHDIDFQDILNEYY